MYDEVPLHEKAAQLFPCIPLDLSGGETISFPEFKRSGLLLVLGYRLMPPSANLF